MNANTERPARPQNILEAVTRAQDVLMNNLTGIMEGNDYVDPMDRFLGPDGRIWEPLGVSFGGTEQATSEATAPYHNEGEQRMIRQICKHFAKENAYAIAGHTNRINYVVGKGHTYTAVDRNPEKPATKEQKAKVQEWLDEWLKVNKWKTRQRENVLRRDRDGETILRKFPNADGYLRVRWVHPASLGTPAELSDELKKRTKYGIQHAPGDEEDIEGYYIDGELVDASEIQHRKRGPEDAWRGVPISWAVRNHLHRAQKILRNGSTVTEVQSAIGMIRRFNGVAKGALETWLTDQHDKVDPPPEGGDPTDVNTATLRQKFQAGSILNATKNIDYEFPGMSIDPSKYIESLQGELRTIGAAWVQPEFMLTTKVDDTSRAAAFAAESPSVKNFEHLQEVEVTDDTEIIDEALILAVEAGVLMQDDYDAVKVEAEPPELQLRKKLEDTQRRSQEMADGILSKTTAAAESGRNYEAEKANMDQEDEDAGELPTKERPDDFLKDDDADEKPKVGDEAEDDKDDPESAEDSD